MNESMKKTVLNYGIYAAAVTILFSTYAYVMDELLMISSWAQSLVFVISLVVLILGVRAYKKTNGGFATFKEAFTAFVLASFIATVFSFSFGQILQVVDGDLGERLADGMVENMRDMMPGEALENAAKFSGAEDGEAYLDDLHEQIANPGLVGTIKQLFMSLAFYVAIGLVVAAVSKKNRPEFE